MQTVRETDRYALRRDRCGFYELERKADRARVFAQGDDAEHMERDFAIDPGGWCDLKPRVFDAVASGYDDVMELTHLDERFRLRSQTTVFRLVKRYRVIDIDCVFGITLDGKYQTSARAQDVLFLD